METYNSLEEVIEESVKQGEKNIFKPKKQKRDPKTIGVPNICFSLTEPSDKGNQNINANA